MTPEVQKRSGRLTPDEIAEIRRLAALHVKPGLIAAQLGRLTGTVYNAMTAAGLRRPTPRAAAYLRGGKPVRSFSAAEDALIREMAARTPPATYAKIRDACAEATGHRRTPATIGMRLRALTGPPAC